MDKKELNKIIREHKEWLMSEGGERANLSSADLRFADLQSADLHSADLHSANLSSADLSSANLRFANLRSADLHSADLQSADLHSADLQSANLSSADLQSADLRFADLHSADLQSAELRFANLQSADLSSANLRSADLRSADLRFANLRSADLHSADLQSADLRSADLQDTILENINWFAYIGIVPDKKGFAYAYKVTKENGEGIYYGGINYADKSIIEVDEINTNINEQCATGINLATFSWCLNNFTDKSYRLFMFRFNVKDAVCPVGSDGKFRVKKCTKVGECNWDGNLR